MASSWQNYRIEYPAAFLLEVASSMTEVLQGPPEMHELYAGNGKGRVRCISTPLENEVRDTDLFRPPTIKRFRTVNSGAHLPGVG